MWPIASGLVSFYHVAVRRSFSPLLCFVRLIFIHPFSKLAFCYYGVSFRPMRENTRYKLDHVSTVLLIFPAT